MASQSTKRRWFRPRYSLATLFIVVTAICCWLGYELNWIRQRHALVALQRARFVAVYDIKTESRDAYETFLDYKGAGSAPGLLWLFGEHAMERLNLVVVVYASKTDDIEALNRQAWDRYRETDPEYKDAQRLFPEATIGFCLPKKYR